ncbi:MAG: VPDSG-CTERM sorting domain-containing protein [Verrucomicrobiota bacterium]|jgi:hypothetical protein
MKWKTLKYVAGSAVMLGLALTVRAGPITGGISLSGSYTLNGSDLTATTFTGFSGVTVATGLLDSPTGSFAGTGGDAVTMNGFQFKPFAASNPLWSFTAGGVTYDFLLNSLTSAIQTKSLVEVSGNGTLQITGHTDTSGTWTFLGTAAGGFFSFTSSNPAGGSPGDSAGVPDGGATAILLGGALCGLGLVRRKLA